MNELPEATINPDDISVSVMHHERLNPAIWDETGQMRLRVRVALLRAAVRFVESLEVPGLVVEDVIFTGSNAAFNYTPYSDLDVHVVVDFERTDLGDLASTFFNAKKSIWNHLHSIKVRGYDVEMYVEDTKQPVTALGVYSLKEGKWIKRPRVGDKPEIDDSSVALKVEALADIIEDAVNSESIEEVDALIKRVRNMRKAGLAKAGEFSVENIAFKVLRNLGYLDRLYRARIEIEDRGLSVESR